MKTFFRIITLPAIVTITLLCSCTNEKLELDTYNQDVKEVSQEAVPNSYIVLLKEDATLKGETNSIKEKCSKILKKYGIQNDNLGFIYDTAIQGFSINSIDPNTLEKLKRDSQIQEISPNYIFHLDYKQNTETKIPVANNSNTQKTTNGYYDNLGDYVDWGVARLGGYTYSVGKTAWIIDTGVIATDDLNIDYNRSNTFIENDWTDRTGHGTHVAGIIGAKHNGKGTVGIAPGATIVAVKVLDRNGSGSQASILAGINYVARNASYGDVWNYSIGFTNRNISLAYETAFKNLAKVTFGAMAAGNNNDNVQYYSPQRAYIPGAWVVGNHTYQDYANSGSSYGSNVHIWGPGTSIWSIGINGNTFANMSGTSMASPYVAGVLLINNGSCYSDGQITKGGYTAGIAKKN
jgi:subtilisin family serine protease